MPEAHRIVISNTTPIIALSAINQLDLFRLLYTEILIPTAVQTEILAGGKRAGASELQAANYIRCIALTDISHATLLSDLDRGEAETIALALEQRADLVIIDERLGRRHAQRLGLKVTGVLGVLLRAKQQGHVDLIRPMIEQLRQKGIRLGDALVTQTLNLANES